MATNKKPAHVGNTSIIAPTAVAWSNNDIILVAWSYPGPIPECIGFTVQRKESSQPDSKFAALPSYVGWSGGKNDERKPKTTDEWPLQRFNWKDLVAEPSVKYVYRIVPLHGPSDKPQPMDARYWLTTPKVARSDIQTGTVRATFNRGILATQALARKIHKPGGKALSSSEVQEFVKENIAALGAAERQRLTGQLLDTLLAFAARAKKSGRVVGALYELTDDELIKVLVDLPKNRLELVLSNDNDSVPDGKTASGKPKRKTVYDGLNLKARGDLVAKHGDNIVTRYMPSTGIAHNKFLVYVDGKNIPQAVLTGSTNWTPTGLCTQNNNALVVEDTAVATKYLEYWVALKSDSVANTVPKPPAPQHGLQAKALRSAGASSGATLNIAASRATVWFSPNTKARIDTGTSKAPKMPSEPADMTAIAQLMAAANQAIFFLAFQPGSAESATSITFLDQLAKVAIDKPSLLVRGAVSDRGLAQKFNRAIYDEAGWQNAAAVSPAGFSTDFGYFETELVKTGHAIIHDKIIVIDPFDDENCHVITGSHNLGYKASYNNDENMLIVSGNKELAIAYAVHALDVYDHYRWRYKLAQQREQAAKKAKAKGEQPPKFPNLTKFKPTWTGIFRDTDKWQTRYFQQDWENFTERLFWVSDGEPLPPLLPRTNNQGLKVTPEAVKESRKASKPRA
ncbi:UNVERIFIED_ORG: phosphatidylserine/phosphatidylglycerophosphate/cardiolipin synthase-like enzyme [Burkholderia sp. CF145]